MKKNKRAFSLLKNGSSDLSSFTEKELSIKSETLKALCIVDRNQNFRSANGPFENFKLMFPDSILRPGIVKKKLS